MNALAEKTLAPAPPLPALPRTTSTPERANPQALEHAISRLDALPPWLREPLTAYLHHRWPRWQVHRAADNVSILSYQLRQIWRWFVEERGVSAWKSLQRSDVEAWLDMREAAGIQVNTRRTQLTTLFGCLRFAEEQGLPVAANIFRIPYPARPQPLPRYLHEDEYRRLVQTVYEQTDTASPRGALDRAWFLTLAHTGIRTCELLNLRLNDVDFSGQRLFIRGSKNLHERIVFLTPTLSAALAHYLTLRPQTEDDHLWIDKGQPLVAGRVRYCVQRWGQTIQVSVSPHRLRHTLATQLVNQDMPLPSVAKLLGHRSLNTTQHYARLFEQTVKVQFESAIAQIEGCIVDLPIPQHAISENDVFSEHSFDSV